MASFLEGARYAVTGIVIGSAVAAGTDMVFNYALGSLVPGATKDTTVGGQYGRGIFAVVAAGAALAGGVMLGDSLLQMINAGVNDPLYHAIYYNVAISSSSTAQQAVGMVRTIVYKAAQPTPIMNNGVPKVTNPTPSSAAGSTCTGCSQ